MTDGEDPAPRMRQQSTLIASGIALSRVSGLVRDAALAFFLGANVGADAFRAALKIPNLLQNLLGEGVLSASFIPTYARLLHEDREEEAGRVAGAVLGLLVVLVGVLVVAGVLLASPLVRLITPGFTGERFELTVTLVRIMFPGVGLLVLSAWCLGVLNAHRRFFLSYVAPVLWNVGILVSLLTLGAAAIVTPVVAAGIGVVLGGALQTAVQIPTVRRVLAGTLRPSLDRNLPGVRTVLRAFVPIVLGRGVVQISALIELAVASLLAVGAVAVLGYAQTFYLLPIALFGMSVAAAELPSLSTLDATGRGQLAGRLEAGLARSAFFVVGTTVAYVLLGGELVALLFGRGEFDAATVAQVAVVLAVYSLGLLPATGSRLLQSVLYAADDARTPAVIAAVRVAVALTVAVPLMFSFDQLQVAAGTVTSITLVEGGSWPTLTPVGAELREVADNQQRLGAVGLAVGSVVGSWLELILLRRRVARTGARPRLGGGTLPRLLAAAVATAAVILGLRLLLPTDAASWLILAAAGVPGGLTYLVVCRALRVPDAVDLLDRLRRR